jgi:hypothetical protein
MTRSNLYFSLSVGIVLRRLLKPKTLSYPITIYLLLHLLTSDQHLRDRARLGEPYFVV